MRIFVTGATGFVGSAVVQELLRSGHTVVGLARSDANAKLLTQAGAEVFRGSLDDLEGLARAARASEGVIHTAHNHDFVNVSREVAAAEELKAIEAMGGALVDTGRPFIISAGMSASTEDEAPPPGRIPRDASERAILALASRGVRSAVVRLPPTVHGDGDRGLIPILIDTARAQGFSTYLDEGTNRWSAVHRTDAARVYVLALEKGTAGARYHAVAEEGIPTRDIATAIGRGLKVPVISKPGAEAASLGFVGFFFARDVHASSAKTQQQLGWSATGPTLLQDLEQGTYFK